jgi:hypothetical protein
MREPRRLRGGLQCLVMCLHFRKARTVFGSNSCGRRSVNAPRTYRVRLVLFGSK